MKKMLFCFQNCSDVFWKKKSIDQEKKLKFEAEGWEQIVRTEKCQYNFWKISKIQYIIAISIQMEKNNWDLEAYRKSLKILHFMAITSSALLPSFSVISSVVSNLIYEIIMLLPTNFLWPKIKYGWSKHKK